MESKRPRVEQDPGRNVRQSAEMLLSEAEREAANVTATVMDANSLKQLILQTEKHINTNMQMRIKYSDQPERFLESELELYQALKALHDVAAAPELFPVFVRTRCIPSLLGLLSHENADISADVLDLLQEMTGAEDAEPDDLLALVDALLEHDAAAALVRRLEEANESNEDEATAVHSTLSIFEAILEVRPATSVELAQKTPLLRWLLARVRVRGFHANKLYASELVAMVLQQHESNRAALGEIDGVVSLLTAIAQYKRKEPADLEEAELVENLFSSLLLALELPSNQALFLRAEGIELMVLTLKEQKYAARGALRALEGALASNGANCERFVDIRGFKTLFPLVGSSPPPPPPFASSRSEKEAAQRAHDKHVVGLLCVLFNQLTDERRQRLLGKFLEEAAAKVGLLLGMRGAYEALVSAAEEAAARSEAAERRAGAPVGGSDEPTGDERVYLARMDAGLGTLHSIDVVLGHLAASGNRPLRNAVLRGLHAQARSLHDLLGSIEEQAALADGPTQLEGAQEGQYQKMATAVQALVRKCYRESEEATTGVAAQGDGDDR